MKNRIVNWWTYHLDATAELNYATEGLPFTRFQDSDNRWRNPVGEVNNLPSKTVPGMTLSLQELLRRYVKGDPVKTFEPVYLGDDDFLPNNLDSMSEMDRIDYKNDLKQGISDFQTRKAAEAAQKKKEDEIAKAATKAADPKPESVKTDDKKD